MVRFRLQLLSTSLSGQRVCIPVVILRRAESLEMGEPSYLKALVHGSSISFYRTVVLDILRLRVFQISKSIPLCLRLSESFITLLSDCLPKFLTSSESIH